MANLDFTNCWEVTHVKCFGKIQQSHTLHNLKSAIGKWLFIFGESKFDEEGEHVIGSVALVPDEYVNSGRFVGSDIRKFEVSETYGIHILANCRLFINIAL